jgi:hypothetical protein
MGVELTGIRKSYAEMYNIKHKKLVLLDNENSVIKEIFVVDTAFGKEKKIPLLSMGVSLAKPKTQSKFQNKNMEIIYYRYDLDNNNQIDKNIEKYNTEMENWNKRNIIQKMNDSIHDIEFNPKFDKEILLEPLQMHISQLNPIALNVHDETISITKIQALSKKKYNGLNFEIGKYLPYIGVFLLIIGLILAMSVFKIRLF